MIERIGFFIQEDIEPEVADKEFKLEFYPTSVLSFINTSSSYNEELITHIKEKLDKMEKIAKMYESTINPLIQSFLMRMLKRKVFKYLSFINSFVASNEGFYTVNRYDDVININLEEDFDIHIKEEGKVYVDFHHKINSHKYEIVSVELYRIFNSYILASEYSSWHKKRKEGALWEVINNQRVYNELIRSYNLKVLIDYDSKARASEFSREWDKVMTYEEDVRRFLMEADEHIPEILSKNTAVKDEKIFFQDLGEKVLKNSRNIS